jgi:hypothetical protein
MSEEVPATQNTAAARGRGNLATRDLANVGFLFDVFDERWRRLLLTADKAQVTIGELLFALSLIKLSA